MATKPEYMSSEQTAKMLRITNGALQNWRSKDKKGPPYIKSGKRVLYALADVVAWLNERKVDMEA